MYEILPHTADVRVRIECADLEELFEDAGRALVELSDVTTRPDTIHRRELAVESVDLASLLVDVLNELLAVLHVDHLAFERFESMAIETTSFRARVLFREATSWSEDVKAVTYHEAHVTRDGESWGAGIVLDI